MDNHVKPYLGKKPLCKVTADDLRGLYQILLERGRKLPRKNCGSGLAPATVRGIHTTLHHLSLIHILFPIPYCDAGNRRDMPENVQVLRKRLDN